MIKKGDRRALALIGAGEKPQVLVHDFVLQPQAISLGNRVNLSFLLASQAANPQRLVVDYIVHYVKKSGGTSAKVFKLKELTLSPGESVLITRNQSIRDFTTRVHHPGRHAVEIVVNGERLAQAFFDLAR